MSKLMFKNVEVQTLGRPVKLNKPETVVVNYIDDEQAKIKKLLQEQDNIQEENKDLIKKTHEESEQIIQEAKEEGQRIIKEAEDQSFKYIQSAVERAKIKEAEIFATHEKEIKARQEEARLLMEKAHRQAEDIKSQAKREGFDKGYQDGYAEGKSEADRLIDRLKVIIQTAIDKRQEIIQSSEDQIARIILLMARKVVKHITDKDEKVVIENIKAGLQRMQGKEQIVVKVNSKDLEITTEHKEEFIAMIEGLKYVKILEDSRVDRGGCIIETDFGSIDGRIATQLDEVEEKIRDIAHITMFDSLVDKKEPQEENKEAQQQNV